MTSVQLYVYDLSHGLASVYSTAMVGVHLDGVWHTSVVIDGRETYFQGGVVQCPAGKTHLGPPLRVIEMGTTEIPPRGRRRVPGGRRRQVQPDVVQPAQEQLQPLYQRFLPVFGRQADSPVHTRRGRAGVAHPVRPDPQHRPVANVALSAILYTTRSELVLGLIMLADIS